MANKLQIVNLALSRVGDKRISSLTADDPAAQRAFDIYDTTLELLLGETPWSFAKKKTLGVLAEVATYDSEWDFVYQLPSDCVQVLGVRSAGYSEDDSGVPTYGTIPPEQEDVPFEVQGEYLLCDEEEITIQYTYKEEDPTKYAPWFTSALVAALAREFAYARTEKATLVQTLERSAERELRKALFKNGTQKRTKLSRLGVSLIAARGGDGL